MEGILIMKKILSTSLFALFAVVALQSCNATIRYGYGDHRGYNCNRYNNDCGYRRGWYSGYPRRHGGNRFIEETAIVADNSAILLANDYGIKVSSAEKILAITTNATNRDTVVKKLNLSNADMKAISNLEMPSRASVQNVANSLGERSAKVERLLTDFIADVKAEKANQ